MEWRTSSSVACLSSHSRHSYHQCPVVVYKKENELIVKHSGIACGSVFEVEMGYAAGRIFNDTIWQIMTGRIQASGSPEVSENHVFCVNTANDRNRSINNPCPCTHRTNGQRTKPYYTPYRTKQYCTDYRKPSSIAKDQVPSACYRKGKRREDIDLTTGL